MEDKSEKINGLISSIKLLPLQKKIELALIIYGMTLDEERATILNLWYLYKHDYDYFDDLSKEFEKANPRIFLPPLNSDNKKNYDFILKGIQRVKGFIGIEEVFLSHIKTTKEEFEIDRLLYIILAIASSYDALSSELINLSYKNWVKWGKIPFHYETLLHKTTVDILIHKGEHKLLIEEITNFYNDLEKKDRLYWLKYQYTNVLLSFYENGYRLREHSEEELLGKRDSYAHMGDTDDFFYNLDSTI